jgi:hypothetical protein
MKDRRHEHSMSVPLDLDLFPCFAVYSAGHAFNRVQTAAGGAQADLPPVHRHGSVMGA